MTFPAFRWTRVIGFITFYYCDFLENFSTLFEAGEYFVVIGEGSK